MAKHKNDILTQYKRIVIKIGSGLLIDDVNWELRVKQIGTLAKEIAALGEASEIVVVSSGAIAAGRSVLGLAGRALSRQEQQAAAAAGQMVLSKAWGDSFLQHKKQTAQMLLTLQDTESRTHHVNVKETITQLLKFGVVPVINENNTVTQGGSGYGDNDRLAARIASMIQADLLLLLSDIDGLYDGNPQTDKNAQHIPLIESLDKKIMAMAQDKEKLLTSGGMGTKLRAAEIAVKGGSDMIIANGEDGVQALRFGGKHSLFKAEKTSLQARKKWIGGTLHSAGSVMIDDGAMKALLENGKSLLPAGVKDISGDFKKGDTVDIIGLDAVRKAVGLTRYDSATARQIMGKKSKDVESILGEKSSALIHRNDLVIL